MTNLTDLTDVNLMVPDLVHHDLACSFIEEEVGRYDAGSNWSALDSRYERLRDWLTTRGAVDEFDGVRAELDKFTVAGARWPA
jgi:hypothetical protein